MKVLVWQWGRRGAGPLMADIFATALAELPDVQVVRSMSTAAELMTLPDAPANDLPMRTYTDLRGFIGRIAATPLLLPGLSRSIRALGVEAAICAMPAPLDVLMAAALRRAGVPYAVVVHDATLHPGDAFPMQIALQRSLIRGASLLFALSTHVAGQLRAQGLRPDQPLLQATMPPFVFRQVPEPVRRHGGRIRLLSFGRLLPYKGLDLLAEAMEQLPHPDDFELRVVGHGPESPALDRLRARPGVTVENRWVPEPEVGSLLGWADALVLTHREASQSGVAAAALAARRWVVSTQVGGLAEQLAGTETAVLCTLDPRSIAAAIDSLRGRPPPAPDTEQNWHWAADLIGTGLREMAQRHGARPGGGRPPTTARAAPPAG